jgi:hypothetical protein
LCCCPRDSPLLEPLLGEEPCRVHVDVGVWLIELVKPNARSNRGDPSFQLVPLLSKSLRLGAPGPWP